MDAGLLVVRLVFGFLITAHGSQKLFGWFRGHGLAPSGEFLKQLGFRPGQWFAERQLASPSVAVAYFSRSVYSNPERPR